MMCYTHCSCIGQINEVILEARTVERDTGPYVKDKKYINGMPEYTVELKEQLQVTWAWVTNTATPGQDAIKHVTSAG